MQQLKLFETDERTELEQIRDEWTKVRKALFMQNAEMKKMYQELAHEHMIMKLNICRGKIAI